MLHRQVAQLATQHPLAVQQLFSAMSSLASFARSPQSGVVDGDADLFCKLQAELHKSWAVAAAGELAAV